MDKLLTSLHPLLLVVMLGLVVITVISKLTKRELTSDGYQRKSELFSAAERKCLAVLDAAAALQARVFGKVRMADQLNLLLNGRFGLL